MTIKYTIVDKDPNEFLSNNETITLLKKITEKLSEKIPIIDVQLDIYLTRTSLHITKWWTDENLIIKDLLLPITQKYGISIREWTKNIDGKKILVINVDYISKFIKEASYIELKGDSFRTTEETVWNRHEFHKSSAKMPYITKGLNRLRENFKYHAGRYQDYIDIIDGLL